MTIYTIGHSTHSFDQFVALLRAQRIDQLADIRTVPRSRRHPHFGGDALARTLPAAGIAYRHFKSLGGLRKPRRDSINSGWRHPGFRGYADYMQTDEFARGLDDLLSWADAPSRDPDQQPRRTVIMCAEAVWWRCHRQLVADALVGRGVDVLHIMMRGAAGGRIVSRVEAHGLTDFARVADGRVSYPGLV